MDHLKVYYNNLINILITLIKTVPIVCRFGHPFLLWENSLQAFLKTSLDQNSCPFTKVKLRRLHRRFGHPTAERLHRILECSGHDEVSKQIIEYLTKYYSHCQKHGKSPGCFKFVLWADKDPVFNFCIIVDIIYIDGNLVLYVIDKDTRYQAARWLQSLSAKHTWDALRNCWIDTYLGPLDHILHDAGTNFTSKEF
jgi:hypothetical protein